jgi:hypothetical protein
MRLVRVVAVPELPQRKAATERLYLAGMCSQSSPNPDDHTSTAALAARQQTLDLLRAHHAHCLWLPLMVDAALNYFPAAKSLDEITRSPEFYDQCEQANQRSRYGRVQWKAPLAEAALVDTGCTLLHLYLARQTAHAVRALNADAALSDVLADAVRTVFFALVDQYQPGIVDGAGQLRTWGFEAYLSERVQGKVFGAIRKRLTEVPAVDETYQAAYIPPRQAAESRNADVLGVLRRVLPNVLSSDWKREAYFEMVYRGATAADVARRANRKAADLHRFIITPLILELQAAVGATARARFYFGHGMRRAFAELMREHEFEQLFCALPLRSPIHTSISTFPEICSPTS